MTKGTSSHSLLGCFSCQLFFLDMQKDKSQFGGQEGQVTADFGYLDG
jgi:hypothetical protein